MGLLGKECTFVPDCAAVCWEDEDKFEEVTADAGSAVKGGATTFIFGGVPPGFSLDKPPGTTCACRI